MSKLMSLKKITEMADSMLSRAKDELNSFQKNLDTNPKYAFEWADSAMKSAAKRDVALYVLESINSMVENGKTSEEIALHLVEYATRETLYRATLSNKSTSVCSNAMMLYTNAAWAEIAHKAYEIKRYGA